MTWRIITADALDGLREMPDESVQCCVTSPPYWGLRNYGVDGQIGLEDSPDEHVARLVEVFREVRRVLRSDGVLWLNYGDSYAGNPPGNDQPDHSGDRKIGTRGIQGSSRRAQRTSPRGIPSGLKPKDLIGLPWMLAFALRVDGWWLRSDVIWSKPNPMTESVKDRPTKSHEHVFLLTRSARYVYDSAAIEEEATDALAKQVRAGYAGKATKDYDGCGVQDPSAVKARIIASKRRMVRDGIDCNGGGQGSGVISYPVLTRNARTVWTIATQPYSGAHFATFPEAIAERCIKSGSRRGDIVLDPFAGSGTTLLVAERLGRDSIGIELNPDYVAIAEHRIRAADPTEPTPLGGGHTQHSLFEAETQ